VQISIINTTANGTADYVEKHTITTDALGLMNLVIGSGTPVTGTFSAIDWSKNAKFIKIELDPAGGTSYTDLGTTQLESVPFALFAGSSELPDGSGTMKGKLNFIGKFTDTNHIANSQIFDNGTNVGIGNTNPSQKLTVNGNVQLSGAIMPNGDAGTTGKVLTSNGSGTAPSWELVGYQGGGRCRISIANNHPLTSGRQGYSTTSGTTQNDTLDFSSHFEVGNDFTISSSGTIDNKITINRTGLYHFEGLIRIFATSALTNVMAPRATLTFFANQPSSDFNILLLEDLMDVTGTSATGSSTNTYNYSAKFSLDMQLEANSKVYFVAGLNNLRFLSNLVNLGVTSGGYIEGHFISE
jgi:hypothetical protein